MSDPTKDYDRNLFGEIERFIELKILDQIHQVPDRLELLRVFQFLDFEIDYARLCWNGSCHRCIVKVQTSSAKENEGMSCRMRSCEGLQVNKLPPTIKIKTAQGS